MLGDLLQLAKTTGSRNAKKNQKKNIFLWIPRRGSCNQHSLKRVFDKKKKLRDDELEYYPFREL